MSTWLIGRREEGKKGDFFLLESGKSCTTSSPPKDKENGKC